MYLAKVFNARMLQEYGACL